eukprot:TRINITY_DN5762_c0_g1_i1.p1 TRINITY_DN5762_c0_g1~~TRINITY_DN5762_c0_g1_i1.p1  ORF type:complete len:355 (-),score=70.39 TRINITY_DN5762_c0_g1_i1:109-1038(-)
MGNYRGNEDYYAIFDGHGGDGASNYASQNLHKSLDEQLKLLTEDKEEDIKKAILAAFSSCNGTMKQYIKVGTTALVVYVDSKERLWVANLGDCRAVLCKKFEAIRVTDDHKPSSPGEVTRIRGIGGFICMGRVNGVLAVTRSLGDYENRPSVSAEPEIFGPFDINDKDNQFLILACDGLWDVIEDQEAVDIVLHNAANPQDDALCLLNSVKSQSTDNVSVIVLYFPYYVPLNLSDEESTDGEEHDNPEHHHQHHHHHHKHHENSADNHNTTNTSTTLSTDKTSDDTNKVSLNNTTDSTDNPTVESSNST